MSPAANDMLLRNMIFSRHAKMIDSTSSNMIFLTTSKVIIVFSHIYAGVIVKGVSNDGGETEYIVELIRIDGLLYTICFLAMPVVR